MAAAFALVLLVASGQLPSLKVGVLGDRVVLSADCAEVLPPSGPIHAEGSVRLKSGSQLLCAETLDYDLETRVAVAGNGLVVAGGNLLLLGREGEIDLTTGHALLTGAELFQKKSLLDLDAVSRAPDPLSLRHLGRNVLLLRAERLERLSAKRFVAERVRLTPCDCGEAEPDWSIRARRADVVPGERAWLGWPVVYVGRVPVLPLPMLYVPLSPRKSGLLVTRPGYSASNGWFVDQPLFLTLGPSFDTTLSAGWLFGTPPPPGQSPGMRGPRLMGELRYAPQVETVGRLNVVAIDDRNTEVGEDHPRGARGQLEWRHDTALSQGLGAHADLFLVSDTTYLRTMVPNSLNNTVPYLRSQLRAGWTGHDSELWLSNALYQDKVYHRTDTLPDVVTTQTLVGPDAPATFQRPMALWAASPRRRLVGPLRGGVDLSAAHYQPFGLLGGTLFAPALGLERVDLTPTLSLPLLLGPLSLEAQAFARGEVRAYRAYDSPLPTAPGEALPAGAQGALLRGRAGVGAVAATQIFRDFALGKRPVRHIIVPRLELKGLTSQADPAPAIAGVAVDEYVNSLPMPALLQGVVAVSTRLVTARGDLARVELGQDVDLGKGRWADTFGRLDLGWGPATIHADAHYDPSLRAVNSYRANFLLQDLRGDQLSLGAQGLVRGGNDRMRADLDELFGWRAATGLALDQFGQLTGGIGVKPFRQLGLRYGALVQPPVGGAQAWSVLQHNAGLSLTTDCDCWKLDALMYWNRGAAFPSVHAVLTIQNLGKLGI